MLERRLEEQSAAQLLNLACDPAEGIDHQTVLLYIDQATGSAQDAKLQQLLTIARPTIEMHLGRAREIRAKLGAGGAP